MSETTDKSKIADELFPGGFQNQSKLMSTQRALSCPRFMQGSSGCRIQALDGRRFIDMGMGMGSYLLGYGDVVVNGALIDQIQLGGGTNSLAHSFECDVGLLIKETIPAMEKIRFLLNGSDAVNAAVRLARHYTQKPVILFCKSYNGEHHQSYHGWSDWFAGKDGMDRGVPDHCRYTTDTFIYNDFTSLHEAFIRNKGQVAAVVMEGMKFIYPASGFLEKVRDLATSNEALVVFDEIVNGLRLAWGGAHEAFGANPDLVCLGKAFGNGYPISVVGGKADIMDNAPHIGLTLTHAGSPFSLAAMKATMAQVLKNDAISRVRKRGEKFLEEFRVVLSEKGLSDRIAVFGYPSRFILEFRDNNGTLSENLFAQFQRGCVAKGVLTYDIHNLCLSHESEDLDLVLAVYKDVLETITW